MRSLTYRPSVAAVLTAATVLAVVVVGFSVGRVVDASHKAGHGQGNGGASTCPKGEFLAEYRNESKTFSTRPAIRRCESSLNND